jgi:hypothetical protein
MSRPVVAAALALALATAACGHEESPPLECIDPATPALDTSCMPLYQPTFDNIYTMTIAPKCVGSGCHSDGGNRGGLGMSSIDGAYADLMDADQMRVVPGDPACSEMIIRTTATDPSIKMPPGVSLLPAEKCALVQWVANGAAR